MGKCIMDSLECYIYSKPPEYITVEPLNKHNVDEIKLDILGNDIKQHEMPVWPIQASFQLARNEKKGVNTQNTKNKYTSKLTIYRTQLPLEPAYALTDYKAQGMSLSPVVADIRTPK